MSFEIVTDTSSNLPSPLLKAHGIPAIPFTYLINGEEHTCLDTEAFNGAEYYGSMRSGVKVSTAQINPYRYRETLEPILKSGRDVLFIGMSSGISGSYGTAEVTAAALSEQFPDRRIRLVDTLGASLGEGILVLYAAQFRKKGLSLDATADKLLDMRSRMAQVFTVDDLMHLKSTGRLFGAAAKVGTMLQIKPLLKGNEDGRIVVCGVARGFKKAIAAMAKKYDELVSSAKEQIVGIAHADCPEAAERLAELLRLNNPPREIMTVCYEPVTGSHVGPGTLALFFMGADGVRKKL